MRCRVELAIRPGNDLMVKCGRGLGSFKGDGTSASPRKLYELQDYMYAFALGETLGRPIVGQYSMWSREQAKQ